MLPEIDSDKKNDVKAFLTTFGNVFFRNNKKFQKKMFRDFETNFPETKKCFELFCFENSEALTVAKLKCETGLRLFFFLTILLINISILSIHPGVFF